MLHEKKTTKESLEDFLNQIEPAQAEETIQDAFLNYVTSDVYCGMPLLKRDQQVHVISSVINLFKKIGGKND